MKKSIAMFIISAIITGWIGVFIFGDVIFADQEETLENEENNPESFPEENEYLDNAAEAKSENLVKKSEKDKELVLKNIEDEENNGSLSVSESDRNKEEVFGYGMKDEKQESMLNKDSNLAERRENTNSETENEVSLQIPKKLDIIIDPFEISGKGQIYSKEYSIKNCGETAGLLKITNFMCTPGKNSGVIVKNDSNGIHETNEKLAYMEILFGNGDRITLPSEEAEYEVRLKPGEELSFFYEGEVNENASQSWKEHDLTLGMVYFWNIEKEILDDEASIKEEEIPVFDSENLKNVTKKDELKATWKEDMSDISEDIDFKDMNPQENSFFEENINKENDEKN